MTTGWTEKFICSGCQNGLDAGRRINGLCYCDSCSMVNFLPLEDTKNGTVNLLHNANAELLSSDFYKAFNSLRQYSQVDRNNPEVYFGMALTSNRIKYVYDLEKEEYMPVCMDLSEKEFAIDANVQRAMQRAENDVERENYGIRAAQIDTFKANYRILRASGSRYDLYVCNLVGSKDNDHWSNRLLNSLTKAGLTVFDSSVDARQMKGDEKDAAILYAMQNAKAFVLICDDVGNLNSTKDRQEYIKYYGTITAEQRSGGCILVCTEGEAVNDLPGIPIGVKSVNMLDSDCVREINGFIGKFKKVKIKLAPASSAVKARAKTSTVRKNAETNVNFLDNLFGKIRSIFKPVIRFVKHIPDLIDEVPDLIKRVPDIVKGIPKFIKSLPERIRNLWDGFMEIPAKKKGIIIGSCAAALALIITISAVVSNLDVKSIHNDYYDITVSSDNRVFDKNASLEIEEYYYGVGRENIKQFISSDSDRVVEDLLIYAINAEPDRGDFIIKIPLPSIMQSKNHDVVVYSEDSSGRLYSCYSEFDDGFVISNVNDLRLVAVALLGTDAAEDNREDIEGLYQIIMKAESIDRTIYTPDSLTYFDSYYWSAVDVYSNLDSTSEEIQYAIDNLTYAFDLLVYKADFKALLEVTSKVEKDYLGKSKRYTSDSYDYMIYYYQCCMELLGNENATQYDVDSCVESLRYAIEGLEKKRTVFGTIVAVVISLGAMLVASYIMNENDEPGRAAIMWAVAIIFLLVLLNNNPTWPWWKVSISEVLAIAIGTFCAIFF